METLSLIFPISNQSGILINTFSA